MRNKLLLFCCILTGSLNMTFATPSNKVTQLYDSLNHILYYRQLSNFKLHPTDKDKENILTLYHLQNPNDDPVSYAKIQYLDAFTRYNDSSPDYPVIDSLLNEAGKVLVPNVYPEDYARIILIQGGLHLRHNYDYAASYHLLNEAVTIFKKTGNSLYLAKSYSELGNLWMELGEYSRSLEYSRAARKIYEESNYKNNTYYVNMNECAVYFQQQHYDKAIKILSGILPYAENSKDTIFIFSIYNNIAGDYAQTENYEKSLFYFQKTYQLIEAYSHPSERYKAHILNNLGQYYFNKEEYDRALEYLSDALTYATLSRQKMLELQIYNTLSHLYNETDNSKEAYNYLHSYILLKDSLSIDKKMKDVQRLRFQEELRSQQQQLQIAEQAANIRHTQLILTIVIGLFSFILVLLIFNHRKKLKEAENKRLSEQLENEEMKNRLQQIEYDKEVEAKEREIATSKLLIAEKGALMEQLLETFEPYYEQEILSEKMWKEMKRFTGINQKKDDAWSEFTLHFDKVHPDFFKVLKELCADLTENELRICSYFRIGMRSKQIAEMLSVSHHSILTNRYRIKKKLKLDKEDSLDNFLRNI